MVDIGRDPVTNRRRQKWHTVHGTKRDAERELAKILNALNTGSYVEPSRETVREFFELWLEDHVKLKRKPTTYGHYEQMVRLHIVPALGSIPLGKLMPIHLQRLYAEKLNEGRHDKSGGLSAKTVKHIHTVLKAGLNHAVRLGLVSANAALRVDPPKAPSRPPKVWTAEQARDFLIASRADRYFAAYWLALVTGMRRGEILGLRWQDIDWENGRLSIRRELVPTYKGLVIDEPKTTRSLRAVDVSSETLSILRELREVRQAECLERGEPYSDEGLVFSSTGGKPLDPRAFTRHFESLVKKAGLPRIRFHDLRHSHATVMLTQGIHPKVVSERLGHSTIGITLDTYSHMVPGIQREAARKVEECLSPTVKPRDGEN